MRARFALPTIVLTLVACTAAPHRGRDVPDPVPDVVVLGTADGSLVVRSDSGSVLASDAGTVAAPDGSRRYAAATESGTTTLLTRDPTTGRTIASTSVDGTLEVRVASITGDAVALMPPGRRSDGRDLAPPHRRTTLVVADPTGGRDPRSYRLDGNFEPEAFSIDDTKLFLIQYLPALAPRVYRVTYLDLAGGRVQPVFGRFKTPPERMPGVRLTQVFDGTRDQLYTLYTNRPTAGYDGSWKGEESAGRGGYGGDESEETGGPEVTFVHVLSLREGWAYCAGLPRALWGRPASAMAMAPSPDGRHLYIVDSTRGLVADMNTRSLRIRGTVHVDLAGAGGRRTSAVTSADGARLFVGSRMDGSAVYTIDTATMEVADRWSMPSIVDGLILSEDGIRLYAALDDRISVLDAATGAELTTLGFVGASVLHVATP